MHSPRRTRVAVATLPAYYPFLTLFVFQFAISFLAMGFFEYAFGHTTDAALETSAGIVCFGFFLSFFREMQAHQKPHE